MYRSLSIAAAILLGAVPMAMAQHVSRADMRKCTHFGFKQGTEAFANCMLQLETNRSQVQAAATHAHGLRDSAAIQAQAARDIASQQATVDVGTGEAGFASVLGRAMTAPQGSTEPPPAYDRYGRANYDDAGNYIGAHGIGALVDDPDLTPSSGGGSASDMVRQDAANIDAAVQSGVDAADGAGSN
jgi:hypothetical protein